MRYDLIAGKSFEFCLYEAERYFRCKAVANGPGEIEIHDPSSVFRLRYIHDADRASWIRGWTLFIVLHEGMDERMQRIEDEGDRYGLEIRYINGTVGQRERAAAAKRRELAAEMQVLMNDMSKRTKQKAPIVITDPETLEHLRMQMEKQQQDALKAEYQNAMEKSATNRFQTTWGGRFPSGSK